MEKLILILKQPHCPRILWPILYWLVLGGEIWGQRGPPSPAELGSAHTAPVCPRSSAGTGTALGSRKGSFLAMVCSETRLKGVKVVTLMWDHHIFSPQFILFFFILMGIAQTDTAWVVPSWKRVEAPALGAVWGTRAAPSSSCTLPCRGEGDRITPLTPAARPSPSSKPNRSGV